MNERIKQITGQVLDEIVPYTWTTLGYDKIKEIQYRTAELIVRECMAIGFHTVYKVDNDSAAVAVYQNIKEHFGVEE
jgi:hypothetical protein